MDFLSNPRLTPKERLKAAQAKQAIIEGLEELLTFSDKLSIEERIDQAITNMKNGLFVLPEKALLNTEFNFSDRHGPFYDFIVDSDLRPIGREIERRPLPQTALFRGSKIIPTQFAGVRFGFKGGTRYSVSLLDIAEAELAYISLRKTGRVIKKTPNDGRVVVEYEGNIRATLLGIHRKITNEFSAYVENLPSTSELEKQEETPLSARTLTNTVYKPHYTLFASHHSRMKPIFSIEPAMVQHRTLARYIYKYWNNNIVKEDLTTAPKQMQNRRDLSMQDILGFFLIDGIARRQYSVQLNCPFPRFSENTLTFARDLTDNLVFTNNGKVKEPAKYQRSAIFTLLHPAFR